MKEKIPKEIKEVCEVLEKGGYQAYLVGGCVRDLLRGVKPKDWDIATDAPPEKIQKLFPKTFYENKFGTVAVILDSENSSLKTIEITPFRLESKYTDKRHPDEVRFAKNLEDDLKRRDFTVNAMALKIKSEKLKVKSCEVIDLFNGQEDLKNKIIRAVGNPVDRFDEDALRILRAIRFASELDFSIEEKTADAIQEKAGLLEMISKERIRDEFIKIIMSDKPAEGMELARELGILKRVAPELEEGWNVAQHEPHRYTVWEHNIRSLIYATEQNWPLETRLASLLHDIGKPRAKQGEGEESTFYNHEILGAEMTAQILNRLKFPKDISEKIIKLVRYHLFYYNVGEVTESSVRRLVIKVGPEHMEDLIRVRIADRMATPVPKAEPYKLRHFRFMAEKAMRDPISASQLKINGDDVMRIAEIPPGPKIGQILYILLDYVLDDPSLNEKKWLEDKIKELGGLPEEKIKELGERAKKKKIGLEEEKIGEIKKKYYVK